MESSIRIKNLELKIDELKNSIEPLKDELIEKENQLKDLEEELATQLLINKTNNVSLGDSIVFTDKNGRYVETMLISDNMDNLDLVILTDCSDVLPDVSRGMKLDKSYPYIDSLIKDVERTYNLTFVGFDE